MKLSANLELNRNRVAKFVGILICLLAPNLTQAEVTFLSETGFISEHTVALQGSPSQAFNALVEEVHLWWDAEHSYSGKASNFSMDTKAGGCFCEKLDNGGSVEHMRVVFVNPGKQLRLQGGLGPLQEMGVNGSMDFIFSNAGDGKTTLKYRYVVSGTVPGGLKNIAGPVDQVQFGQLSQLQKYLAAQ